MLEKEELPINGLLGCSCDQLELGPVDLDQLELGQLDLDQLDLEEGGGRSRGRRDEGGGRREEREEEGAFGQHHKLNINFVTCKERPDMHRGHSGSQVMGTGLSFAADIVLACFTKYLSTNCTAKLF